MNWQRFLIFVIVITLYYYPFIVIILSLIIRHGCSSACAQPMFTFTVTHVLTNFSFIILLLLIRLQNTFIRILNYRYYKFYCKFHRQIFVYIYLLPHLPSLVTQTYLHISVVRDSAYILKYSLVYPPIC